MTDVGLVLVKALASLFTLAMMLSPTLDVRRIHAQKHTGEMALMPLVGLLINSHMWMLYGAVTSDIFPLFVTYIIGDVCSVGYIFVFYHYTAEKAYARRVIASAAAVVATITLYAILGKAGVMGQTSRNVDQIIGYVTVCGSVVLYTSPFETIAHVLKSKSGKSIPVLMCTCGLACNALWIVYGLVQSDVFVWGLGVFCAVFAFVQVVLYFVFHPSKVARKHGMSASSEPRAFIDTTCSSDVSKYELSIAIESPCFTAIKSPLAPLK